MMVTAGSPGSGAAISHTLGVGALSDGVQLVPEAIGRLPMPEQFRTAAVRSGACPPDSYTIPSAVHRC